MRHFIIEFFKSEEVDGSHGVVDKKFFVRHFIFKFFKSEEFDGLHGVVAATLAVCHPCEH